MATNSSHTQGPNSITTQENTTGIVQRVAEQDYPPLETDITVDVAIIGGGLSGIGAAYALHDRGISVVLLEEHTVAWGASGRNAGFVLAGAAAPFHQVVAELGEQQAAEIWQFTVENNRLLADVIDRHGVECGYLRRGSMSLAATEDGWDELHHTHHALQDAGISTCLVRGEQLPSPFDRMYSGGIYYPGNAELDPSAFVKGVARVVQDRISIYEGTPIHAMRGPRPWELLSPRATVRTEHVVVATNAWTPRLLPSLPITPVRNQVVATIPLPRVLVPFPMYANHGYQYWRQTPNGRLIVGGWRNLAAETEVGYEEEINPRIAEQLNNFVATVAGDVDIIDRWTGIMGFTPDLFPVVGLVPDAHGVQIAAGYSGHGVSMAFAAGGRVAQVAIGEQTSIPDAFDPARFVTNEPPGSSSR